jgi:Family of unknown function (DUF5808)
MTDKKDEKKTFLGMPMNWDGKRPFKNLWNAEDDRLFPPKSFGIGWAINFHALLRRLGAIKGKK